MPGPLPKDPTLRQRRNKTTTRATLPPEESPLLPETEGDDVERVIPALPPRGRRKWHALTVSWWEDIWASPMATEFLRADLHGLYILADLVDQYWKKPTAKLAGEIRQQRQCFGLTPMDRRRLQWEVEKVEEAQDKGRRRQRSVPSEDSEDSETSKPDPRFILQAVK